VATPANGAKKPDRVFLPHAKDAIPIRPNSAEMFVLQQLRDEAHRFAITFHRSQRRRSTLRSALATIPGIGPGRQRQLLRHFGSVKRVREASVEELASVPGMSRTAAEAVFAHWAKQPTPISPVEIAVTAEKEAEDQAEELAIDDAFAGVEADAVPAGGGEPEPPTQEDKKQEI
jgi:excinuclease ABC subunit C